MLSILQPLMCPFLLQVRSLRQHPRRQPSAQGVPRDCASPLLAVVATVQWPPSLGKPLLGVVTWRSRRRLRLKFEEASMCGTPGGLRSRPVLPPAIGRGDYVWMAGICPTQGSW